MDREPKTVSSRPKLTEHPVVRVTRALSVASLLASQAACLGRKDPVLPSPTAPRITEISSTPTPEPLSTPAPTREAVNLPTGEIPSYLATLIAPPTEQILPPEVCNVGEVELGLFSGGITDENRTTPILSDIDVFEGVFGEGENVPLLAITNQITLDIVRLIEAPPEGITRVVVPRAINLADLRRALGSTEMPFELVSYETGMAFGENDLVISVQAGQGRWRTAVWKEASLWQDEAERYHINGLLLTWVESEGAYYVIPGQRIGGGHAEIVVVNGCDPFTVRAVGDVVNAILNPEADIIAGNTEGVWIMNGNIEAASSLEDLHPGWTEAISNTLGSAWSNFLEPGGDMPGFPSGAFFDFHPITDGTWITDALPITTSGGEVLATARLSRQAYYLGPNGQLESVIVPSLIQLPTGEVIILGGMQVYSWSEEEIVNALTLHPEIFGSESRVRGGDRGSMFRVSLLTDFSPVAGQSMSPANALLLPLIDRWADSWRPELNNFIATGDPSIKMLFPYSWGDAGQTNSEAAKTVKKQLK